jgi:tetratricopeptide (TPR) repeat protein
MWLAIRLRLFLPIAGLLVLACLLPGPGLLVAQGADDPAVGPDALNQPSDSGAAGVAVRQAPRELPPTQAEIQREKMRAQLRLDGENRFRYAREMFADGYLERARQLLEDFLILFPAHGRRFDALQILAQIESERDRPEGALAAYRRAYAETPGDDRGLEAALRAGRILAGLGRNAEARQLLQDVQRRKPDSRIARLAATELRALELPVGYDGLSDRPDSGETAGPDAGANSDRGLLDGTDRVPTNGGKPAESGVSPVESSDPGGESLDRASPAESPGVSDVPAGLSGDALERMGEGVEQIPR